MQYKSLKGFSGPAQLGMLLVFLGLGFILAGGVQLLIGMQMIPAGTPMPEMGEAMMKALMDPKNIAMARLSQVLGTFLLLFIPAVLYSLVVNGKNPFWLGLNQYFTGKQVFIGFLLILVANLLAAPLADLTKSIVANYPSLDAIAKRLEDAYNEQVLALSNLKSWGEFILAVFIMAFFPALFEEVFFRGALQNLLEKWWKNPILAVIFTSIIFSIIHFSIYLFLSRVVLGFVLGYMYYKTRNLWVNIMAHFINNAIAVSQLFYLSTRNEKLDLDKLEPNLPWWVGIGAVIVLYLLFRLLERISVSNKIIIEAKENSLLARQDPFHSFIKNENS
jgi:membrane protease YdiL (CAAX protease family)